MQDEFAEVKRARHLSVLWLGMTRVSSYDSKGGSKRGLKRFDVVERIVRDDVDDSNRNPLRWVVGGALELIASERAAKGGLSRVLSSQFDTVLRFRFDRFQ